MKRANILILALASLLGCYEQQPQNDPTFADVFFPGSVLSIDDGSRVLVANTAFDRSFDRGHISVLSSDGTLDTSSSVLTGIFSGQMAMSDTLMDGQRVLLLPTREDDLVEVFSIGTNGDAPIEYVEALGSFGPLPMSTGPMSAIWSNGYFLVGHGSGRTVSAWSLDPSSGKVEYGCSIGLPNGVHFMAAHPQTGSIYVTSRFSGSIAVLRLEDAGWNGDPSTRTCRLTVSRYFDSRAANTHALEFSPDGARLYVTSIVDGTLTLIDTAANADGVAEEVVLRRQWVGPEAGVVKLSPYDGSVYVAIAKLKRLIQLDPLQLSVTSDLDLSSRPFDFDFSEGDGGELRVLVSFFADHQIGVIEIQGETLTEVGKIGASQ